MGVNEPVVGSRRCTGGGLFAGRDGEFPASAVGFVKAFLAGGGGGFGVPVEIGVGEPPNLGLDINEAAAAATRPGPLWGFSSV